ncbi:hypothetical protein EVAR_89016_1 [Eumeta japonica]|uniref:Uncharacterized protein n=1 Tax=Eumeta variegata TaxID=151549 RepID=A0A4C1XCR2_EUMVA|nr:hypothetical protein EVAR_89016_1 [Eumeta japonica]
MSKPDTTDNSKVGDTLLRARAANGTVDNGDERARVTYAVADSATPQKRVSPIVNESSGGPFHFHHPISTIRHRIPSQEVGNATATPLGLRVSMGGGDRAYFPGG